MGLPPLDSSSLYYSSSSNLPSDTSAAAAAQPGANGTTSGLATASPDALWQTTNLPSSLTPGHETAGGQPAGATKSYTVVRGDSFSRIASRNGTSVSALRAANPEIDPARIKPGDKLNVPEAAPKASSATLTGTTAPTGAGPAAPGNIYVVKTGDTLSKIARSHGVTISQLRAANPNSLKTSRVNVGQKLKIPPPNPSQASTAGSNSQRTPNL
jgi:peptidoglycan DL-endopeptidase LytE